MWNSLHTEVISACNTKLFDEHLLDTHKYQILLGYKVINAVHCSSVLIFVNVYKGRLLTPENEISKELDQRIAAGWKKFGNSRTF